ncbi:MAG: hypothetical protein KF752_18985 [Pirellulaceae bacterium]|nr:hypothetical protein [Pirellulaceae bacterium]
MLLDRQTAKSLCTAAEFKLYEMAAPKLLASLTVAELNDAVKRSRTLRDKWVNMSRAQRRSTQSAKGARQTAANARSDEKAALFAEVYRVFVERRDKLVDQSGSGAATGSQQVVLRKQDRKIVTRAVRSTVKDELKKAKRAVNRTSKAKAVTAVVERSTDVNTSAAKTVASSAAKSTARTAGKSAGKKKIAAISSSRKKLLAKRPAVAVSQTAKAAGTKTRSKLVVPTGASLASSNRPVAARAAKARIARGGGKRVQAHLSASGQRSQARRDSKR